MRGLWAAVSSSIVVSGGVAHAEPPTFADFDGDGFADLAVGVWHEYIGDEPPIPGAVQVIYGTAAGLNAGGNQFWHQNSPGILDTNEVQDEYGKAVASGDFDNDGFADLIIGIPQENAAARNNSGAVSVIYGSASGLTSAGNQFPHQDVANIDETAEAFDYFGWDLSVGDFNGDNFDDAVVSIIFEDVGPVQSAGSVQVIYGSSNGLSATFVPDQWINQNSAGGIQDVSEESDHFGETTTAGDFNGDGYDDLAAGVSNEETGGISNAGAVNVIYGSATGLAAPGNQFWHQTTPGILDAQEAEDQFGEVLAAGDFDGDGFEDLAIGVPYEDIGALADAGGLNVIYGSASGLTSTGNQFWHQDSTDVPGAAEAGDLFGWSLAVGDFNNDGFDDLAIGAYGDDVGALSNAGAVNVLLGSSNGLTSAGSQIWHQDVSDVLDAAEAEDAFGWSVGAADYDGDGFDDLVIGVVSESIGAASSAGAVHVLYGSPSGPTAVGDQFWHQNVSGVLDACESGDDFGYSLMAK